MGGVGESGGRGPVSDQLALTKELLRRLGDEDYRLHGEDPATATLEQAQRWAATYERLIGFKRELLERTYQFIEESEVDAARAMKEADLILLEVQLSRFEQRRDFWHMRASELAGERRVAG